MIKWIIISAIIFVYAVSTFAMRRIHFKVHATKKLDRIDLSYILVPVLNTVVIIARYVFIWFIYMKSKVVRFIKWFVEGR